MRSLILTLVVLLAPIAAAIVGPATEHTIQQRDIRTYKDYKELEQLLLAAYSLGDPKAAYSLGLLYSNGFEFPSKNVTPNYEKARKYFREAMLRGVQLAAYNIALIDIANNRKSQALNVLREGLESKKPSDVEVVLASTFATIVLDYFRDDEEAINDAARYLHNALRKKRLATMEYLLANLYLASGNEQLANRYLTLSCTNPNAPDELLQICFYSNNIEVVKKGAYDKEDIYNCNE